MLLENASKYKTIEDIIKEIYKPHCMDGVDIAFENGRLTFVKVSHVKAVSEKDLKDALKKTNIKNKLLRESFIDPRDSDVFCTKK